MIEAKYSKYLDKIRKICFALPEVKEVEAWGHPTFRAPKKLFAAFGVDEIEGPNLGLKMSFVRQEQLLEDPRFYPTPYAAHQGWVSLRLKTAKRWQEVKTLLIEAYCQVASRKLIEALDAD